MIFQIIVIQILTFVGLILMLRFLFYRQLNDALLRLKALHEENIAREEVLKSELDKIEKEKQNELVKAKRDAGRIIEESKDRALKMGMDMQAEAQSQAQRIVEKANENSKKMTRDIDNTTQAQAIDLSIQILKLTLTERTNEVFHSQLTSELIKEIENLPVNKFTVKEKIIKISSALVLTKEESSKMAKILAAKTGHNNIELVEDVNSDLIAGLIVQIGSLIIDGSLRNKMKKAISYISKIGTDTN